MPSEKKEKLYLTKDGVVELRRRAHNKGWETGKAIADKLHFGERAFRNLISGGVHQASISDNVKSGLMNIFDFSAEELKSFTSNQRRCESAAPCAEASVRAAPLDEVKYLYSISRDHRKRLYKEWCKARPLYAAPTGLALPETDQQVLQNSLSIDLAPLQKLLGTIGVKYWEFKLPVNPQEFDKKYTSEHLKQFCQTVFESIKKEFESIKKEFESINKFPEKATAHSKELLTEQLKSVTDYLCKEYPLTDHEVADLAFVPGYRSYHRAELAGQLFKNGQVRKIYLSGHSPYYARNEDTPLPLTEALAMAVYLIDFKPEFKIKWDDLVVETGGHCTPEHVSLFERTCSDLASQYSKPLTVLIVTSPYHLRRAWLTMQRLADRRPTIVGSVRCVAAKTRSGLGKDKWYKNKDGVTAYMTEYWKIYCGRVVGEF